MNVAPCPPAIQTAAMEMLGGAEVGKQCRNVDIMSDAAYAILGKPRSYTGNFVIDEEILKTEGIKDFGIYAVAPGTCMATSGLINTGIKQPDTVILPLGSLVSILIPPPPPRVS